jgi:gamma-glutamyltranspeptidase
VHLTIATLLLLQAGVTDSVSVTGARGPAYAPDGRLVLSIQGNLFLQSTPKGTLRQITSGAAWDRDPVFTHDGSAVVFASDRAGNYDLHQVAISPAGEPGGIRRLTSSPAHETSPAVAGDGRLLFVRGSGAAARLWVRDADGKERRLHPESRQAESAPAVAADLTSYAYIASSETGRRVMVRSLATGDSSLANADRNAERIAWAPAGDRLVFSARSGTFVVPRDGRYTNFVSGKRGDLAWSPDGRTLAIAEYDQVTLGYKGDPDRLLDRTATDRIGATERLYLLAAPAPPDAGLAEHGVTAARARVAHNADAFDRLWERSNRLYFSAPDAAARRAEWERVRTALRPRAITARTDDELQQVLHDAITRRPPLRVEASGRAAVSSAHPVATEAGLEILRAGGNVVDAAVAVSFALGVVEPDASGIGGYGEMVIALRTLERPTLIEFMSRVPEEASLSNTSLLQNGRYPADGPVLTNVPGTVAGMHEAWRKFGSRKLAWARLLEPAIRAARDGYEVSEGLATTLATEREHFAKYEGSRALFFRDGEPLVAGDTIRNPDLAWVLGQIARGGADGFYRGEVARRFVADLRANGNAMKLTDMERYFAPERPPVSGTYRGYTIYSGAPPVSGGAELVARLNLLEQFPSPRLYTEDATTLHAALTAWFLVPSSRNRIADPALWPVNIAPIVDRDTARARWKCFDATRALRPADVRGEQLPCLQPATAVPTGAAAGSRVPPAAGDEVPCGADHAAEMHTCHAAGTTAFTVADNDGNVVAVTQTLGTWGGNFYVTPGLGFLSNDKLTSYGTDPSQYGSRLPFARHGSTIAPTIVMKGRTPVFAIGAAGNAWITSAIYQGMIGALDFNLGPQQVLELPRFLPSGGGFAAAALQRSPAPYTIQLEDGFSPAVIRRLRELGYEISFVSMRGELREGYGAAIRIDGRTVTAGADPRRSGAAGAIR